MSAEGELFEEVFVRDGGKCRYCELDLLKSLDAFVQAHLDHLKPNRSGGADLDPWNRVMSCAVCNFLKAGFDPSPAGAVTRETFHSCIARARERIEAKRRGELPSDYVKDYKYWLEKMNRA